MPTYKLVLAYDGTDFHGWQIQPRVPTIAGCMQNHFCTIFKHSIHLLGASRTDSGVHALGQVARLKTDCTIASGRLHKAWSNALPASIVIRSLELVDDAFHPHRNVVQKTYYYHLFYRQSLPFISRYGWLCHYVNLVDWHKFERALQYYIGTHDFASFASVPADQDTVRSVQAIKLERIARYSCVRVIIKGKGFLRFQIRRMIGYALDIARRPDYPVDYIQHLLHNANREQILLKAAGSGLILRKILYKNQEGKYD